MNARIIIASVVLSLLGGCLRPQLAVRPSTDRLEVLNRYERFQDQPSKERLLDLLVACSETKPTEETFIALRDHLRKPDRAITAIDGVDYTDHAITVACLSAIMGTILPTDSLAVKAIVSRRVGDTPYRYHLHVIEPDDARRLDRIASAWIDGFLAGRRIRESE
jgi:hypothetical protein